MRAKLIGVLVLANMAAGCHQMPDMGERGAAHGGRFFDIGVFDAGHLWSLMVTPKGLPDAATATIADDEHVIVVVDSLTGEIRECGDHSGYCVGLNPWTKPAAGAQRLPVAVTKHAAELTKEAKIEMDATKANASVDDK